MISSLLAFSPTMFYGGLIEWIVPLIEILFYGQHECNTFEALMRGALYHCVNKC